MILVASAIAFGSPSQAFGYSGSSAASYADSHWNICGVYHKFQCINDDCTAFVSEAMNAGGGYAQDTNGTVVKASTSDDTMWYMHYNPVRDQYYTSKSFTFVQDLRTFLIGDVPGGIDRGTKAGTSLAYDSGGDTGDVLFYNWDPAVPDGGSEPYDHANLIVGYGFSEDDYYGDYIDGHTNYRLHTYWTTRTYNAHVQTTVIDVMHISSTN
jgi:hypothetical protein